MLFICDLYAPIRSKLIKTLHSTVNEAIPNTSKNDLELENIKLAFQNISISSLEKDFTKLQSPSHDLLLNKNDSISTLNSKITCTDIATPYTNVNQTASNSTKDTIINSTTNTNNFFHHETSQDPLQFHFNQQSNKNSNFLDKIRLYIQNALASFTCKCFDKRAKFLKELSKKMNFNDVD